ncbi:MULTISPECIES: DMT family transporter [Acidianus]|uniref:Permease n=1 Tax=Candidatus Acidianus copahuensis TaxID=1160895 RepID=A0A031LP31_9CREN|nr:MULTISPECIES: DMT family transporter [Acidianus]EZQ06766.1 permease [Candidatus Acidianus copahuensis]NON61271.1 EamA family transporter [Acidianus sp. RZ1]
MNKFYAILVIGGISFGFAAIFIKISGMSPGSITFFRFAIAGLILSLGKINPRKILQYAPLGFLLSIHMILFILGVYNTTIIDATVLVSTSPFFSILFASLGKFKSEKLDYEMASLGFLGVLIMNYPLNNGDLLGNILSILSALSISIYTLLLSKRSGNVLEITSSIYLSSAFFSFPLFAIEGLGKVNLTSILALIGLILIPTLIGHTSVIYTSGKVKPQHIETIGLLEPVVATIISIPLFNQIPSVTEVVGGFLVLLSVLVIIR